jgi:hypothetical protein
MLWHLKELQLSQTFQKITFQMSEEHQDISENDIPAVGRAPGETDVSENDVPAVGRSSGENDVSGDNIPVVGKVSVETEVSEDLIMTFSG